MGMKTSGAVFQKLMNQAIEGLQPKCILVYIDNIYIFSKMLLDYVKNVHNVLQ